MPRSRRVNSLLLVLTVASCLFMEADAATDSNRRLSRSRRATQSRAVLNVTIVEEQAIGSAIIELADSISGLSRRDSRFQFFPPSDFFDVTVGGTVVVKSRIDRDALCDDENPQMRACCRMSEGGKTSPCTLDSTIMIESRNEQHLVPFSAIIKDKNDNPPVFTFETASVSIYENTKAVEVPLPIATDRDVDSNDIQEYRLDVGNYSHIFELRCSLDDGSRQTRNATSCRRIDVLGQSSPLRPTLFVRTQTDREAKDSYDLQLVAIDGGSRPLSSTVTVRVLIADVNDHTPTFMQTSFTFNVSESEQVGSEIGQVLAIDEDLDKNAEIDYFISSHSRANEMFSIDHGILRLNNHLDYDGMQQQYRFSVIAQDGGQLSATASVTINILDANDNRPLVNIHLVNQNSSEKLVLVENESNLQRILGMVEAYDGDSERDGNNNVTCATDNSVFHLVPQMMSNKPGSKRYSIYARQALDREMNEAIEFSVTCSDRGSPPLFAQVHLLVEVNDVNDNAPVLTGSRVFEIYENSVPETSLGVVSATDRDQQGTENSTITYRITDDVDAQFFAINERTGELFSAKSFDREERASYRLNITLSDHGSPPLSSTYELTVLVRDVNDRVPEIRPATTVFNVREDLPPNTAIGRLEADDADEPNSDNARVRFRLVTGDDYFLLTEAGDLFTRTILDREQIASHVFEVSMSNFAEASQLLTSIAVIRVNVMDVKDSPPRFLSKVPVANVSCYETNSIDVAKVTAVDDDLLDTIRYSITHGNELGLFSIDEDSGVIRLVPTNWRCSTESLSVYKLHVIAIDSTNKTGSTIVDVVATHDSGVKPSAVEYTSLLNSESVKIIIVLICASLVLATAMIVVILVFKVRPKRNGRYMQTAPADHSVYPKPSDPQVHNYDHENHSDARSSSEERYAAVIDDNNNGDSDSDDNNDMLVHRVNEENERLAKTAALQEKAAGEYDSTRSSQVASLDNRSTLTRAADRELLYYTHNINKHQIPIRAKETDSSRQQSSRAADCECTTCQTAYASVAEYPYATTLGRPILPLQNTLKNSMSMNSATLLPSSTGYLPRRLTATGGSSSTLKQSAICNPQHPMLRGKDCGKSMYGDALYCSACDALTHCPTDDKAAHHAVSPVTDTVIQLHPGSERVYGTQLRKPSMTNVKSFVARPSITASPSTERNKNTECGSVVPAKTIDRSLTYFSPKKLAEAVDPTYAEHSKSSPYYSVSYV